MKSLNAITTWGACILGLPGSGKSAVFSGLHQLLEQDASILTLSNIAGGTQRGSNIDAMLRRWITELSAAAGVPNPLPDNAPPDEVESTFYSLLGRVSTIRRIVVLLDALDQFEPSPRGRYLTWFKVDRWPANTCIIATTLLCPAADALTQWAGIEEIELPALRAADASIIAQQVWGRYHRELNPSVLQVLIDKTLPNETPSCGNPLWLTLALEQLNLLDGDDFARAERQFTGSPAQRLTALLIDTATRMPPDIAGLYRWLLEQNERTFGRAHVRGFALAIALSHFGWREADLRDLAPRLGKLLFPDDSVPPLDDLALAVLRRSFRAHLLRRGENGQLDFFHTQMRRATIDHCAPDEPSHRRLHAAISDYLETLSPGDPLIRLERMGQLIGQRNALRAATYYATLDVGPTVERVGSSWTLVDWIAAGELTSKKNVNLAWILSWLEEPDLTPDQSHRLANNLQFGLLERMENEFPLHVRQQLVESIKAALTRLAAADPSNAGWQRDLSVSHNKVGDVLSAQGDLAGALKAYRESLAVAQRLAAADPSNAEWQRDLFVSYVKMAQMSVETSPGEAGGWWRKAYDQLSMMQKKGIMRPTDANALAYLRQKVGLA